MEVASINERIVVKYSIELGPVECRIGSTYEFEIEQVDEVRIRNAFMKWYRSLPDSERRHVKTVDVYPEFIRRGGTATTHITIKVTCTAGTLEKVPDRMTIPEGHEKGWELSFYHQSHGAGDEYLKKFAEVAKVQLGVALDHFKQIKPRVSIIWRE